MCFQRRDHPDNSCHGGLAYLRPLHTLYGGMTLTQWYQEEAAAVLAALNTRIHTGLNPQEVADRLAQNGPNELVERGRRSP